MRPSPILTAEEGDGLRAELDPGVDFLVLGVALRVLSVNVVVICRGQNLGWGVSNS